MYLTLSVGWWEGCFPTPGVSLGAIVWDLGICVAPPLAPGRMMVKIKYCSSGKWM